ncbi:MAG: hypothetical protein IJG56_05050 [Clostridia bacterium]|nr:hypothetical protein [Clostridia bacterium]
MTIPIRQTHRRIARIPVRLVGKAAFCFLSSEESTAPNNLPESKPSKSFEKNHTEVRLPQESDLRIHFVSIREPHSNRFGSFPALCKTGQLKARMTENQHVSAGPAETCFYEGKSAKMTKPAYLNLRFLAASDFFFLFTLGFS